MNDQVTAKANLIYSSMEENARLIGITFSFPHSLGIWKSSCSTTLSVLSICVASQQ